MTSPQSVVRRVALVLVAPFLLAVATVTSPRAHAQPATSRDLAPASETIQAAGLDAPAEILIDRWGVAHIFAADQDDLFFLQGWNAARDRLWQLDLWRRRGEGRLADVFGPAFIEQDRAARLFLYRGDMHAEWIAYASDTKRIVTSFVAGINAYIELTEREPERLPPEFEALDYQPERWQPETVVRIRSHGLLRNLRSEVARGRFLASHGELALALRDRLEPEHTFEVPAEVDLPAMPDELLETYDLGTRSVSFEALANEEASRSVAAIETLSAWATFDALGSNNWAIAPSRTATGRPVLADDPHRTQALPSLRYIVHLAAPGLDVVGAGEPALPGVSIGHNGTVAFGLTIFSIDQEDLYFYDTHPENSDLYNYRGFWEPVREIEETIAVRGEASVTATLRFTRHGPILFEEADNDRLWALRAAWLEPGMAPYLGSIESMRAETWDEFLAAMNRWGSPSENQVYADTAGNIGWKPGGLTPIRENWDGLVPVPGDGRFEWTGYRPMDELPVEENPARGWVATANQMNLPPDYDLPLGWEWAAPYRFERIREVLSGDRRHSVQDSLALQGDSLSIPARRLQKVLEDVPVKGRARQARQLLLSWNAHLDIDSGAAALFEIWWRRHLPGATWAALANQRDDISEEATQALVREANVENLLRLLENRLTARDQAIALGTQVRSEVITTSLAAAWLQAEELMGKRVPAWRWGDLHQIEPIHPLAGRLEALGLTGRLPATARPGSSETVGNTRYGRTSFRQISGASFRLVLDVGAWDQSLAMNSPGQSGDPRSPHFGDLLAPWAAGEAFPLLYSRASIEGETLTRLVLTPLEP